MTDQPPAHPAAPDSEDTSPPADGMVDVKGVSMVLVPAGDFMMGSENGDASEQPAHTVTLDAFYIDRFEVTNDRYAECVQAGYCSAPTQSGSYNRTSYYGDARYGGYPVVYVSWQDAYEYCAWRGVRLPTEAEWEKAARGGLDGKRYPWGNEAPSCTLGAWNGANYGACESPDDTWKVGSFGPNLYGVYDMAGNVWEWVADRYSDSYYRTSPPENPPGPVSGALRTVRGGAWGSDLVFLRVAARSGAPPADSSHTVGFRCAVPAGP